MPDRVVIVGGGAAGLRAAERLRELDFNGELIMVCEEPHRPYHRPALSKQVITGRMRPKDLRLPVHADLSATWRYATRAVYLEPEEHLLHLPGGEEIRYDGLVIATGTQARHLPGAPRHDPRIHLLRTVSDAVNIQKSLTRGKGALAIIGGGFVACELASAARAMGRDATIILRDSGLLQNVPGADVGETISALHEANGVQIVTDATVQHWVQQQHGIAMHLNTGQVVVAACVVLGVGTVPAVSWLRGSGLIIDDGVMCGPTTHAIGGEDIVVAGDVARWPNLRFDSVPRRVEHWLNASEMGRAAAENLLLGPDAARPYTPLPRFWTEQHGMRIQAAGVPALAQDTVMLDGSQEVGHRLTGYVSRGNLVGVVGWDSPAGMLKWTQELDKQTMKAMRQRLARPDRTPSVGRMLPVPPPAPGEETTMLPPALAQSEIAFLPPTSAADTGSLPLITPMETSSSLPPVAEPLVSVSAEMGMLPPMAAAEIGMLPPVSFDETGMLPPLSSDSTGMLPPMPSDSTGMLPPMQSDSTGMLPPVYADETGMIPPMTSDETGMLPPMTSAETGMLAPVDATGAMPYVPGETTALHRPLASEPASPALAATPPPIFPRATSTGSSLLPPALPLPLPVNLRRD